MKRFYRLFTSLLVIVGILAVAPASAIDVEIKQSISVAGICDGDQVDYASADIKKKKKKGKKLKGKAGKGKKGFWGKWKSKWKKKKVN